MSTETEKDKMVKCSICDEQVPVSEVCSTLACRACHRGITFEDCVAGKTPEELAWKARVGAAMAHLEKGFDSDIRITLDLEDFKALVNGGIARIETRSPKGYVVKLALKDVGFAALAEALQEAVRNSFANPK